LKNYRISIMAACIAVFFLVVNCHSVHANTMLFDFESPLTQKMATSEQKVERVKNFATSGDFSLSFSSPEKKKVGRLILDLTPKITDWSNYNRLTMDVSNLAEITQIMKIYIADSKTHVTKKAYEGSGILVGSFIMKPKSYTRIDINLTKKLKKGKIDISDIYNIEFIVEKQPTCLYFDNIKIIKSEQGEENDLLSDKYLKQFAAFQKPSVVSLRTFYLRTLKETEAFPKTPLLGTSLLDPLDSRILKLEKHISQADSQVLEIYPELMSLNGNIDRVHSLLTLWKLFEKINPSVRVGDKKYNVMVGFATSMEKVLPRDNPIKLMMRENMEISLAKGERESFQTVVIPLVNIKDVGVTIADLVSDDGIKLSAKHIDTSVLGYVKTQTTPSSGSPYLGWWPDPILNFLKTTDIKAGDAQSFWTRINAPKDQKPGVYRGTIDVHANGLKIFSFKLIVHIYSFSMPVISPLPTTITFAPTTKDWAYIWEDPNLKIQWADFLADYYISYDSLYTHDPDFEVIKHLNEQGRLGMFNLGYFYRSNGTSEAAWAGTMKRIRKYYDEAKELGLLDHAYIYGCDEFRSKQFASVEKAAKDLKREFPDVMVMTTAIDTSYGMNTVLESLDAWCPYISDFYPKKVETVRAEGKQVWWYTCCWPHHPYPNVDIECHAIEARLLMGLITAKYGPDGFLYYQVSRWQNNTKPITSGPFTDWNPNSYGSYNGDGSLTCVGPDSSPLSTIRLENYRDGLEDYAYVIMLDEIIRRYEVEPKLSKSKKAWLKQAKLAAKIPWNIVREVYSFTYDPMAVYAYRNTLAQLIETSGMTDIDPWKNGMGVVRKVNDRDASHLTGFHYDIPIEGGVFGHNHKVPGKGFPTDFSDSFAHFGDITGSNMSKLVSTPGGSGWVVYAFEAPKRMIVDSVDMDVDVWVANSGAASFKAYWSIGDYDGNAAPNPENDTQWVDLKCDLYRNYDNEFRKSFVAGKKRFYLAYYLKNSNKDNWDIQVQKNSENISVVPVETSLIQ